MVRAYENDPGYIKKMETKSLEIHRQKTAKMHEKDVRSSS
jgi:hypothetical protein